MGDLRRMSALVQMLADEIHRAETSGTDTTSFAENEQDLSSHTPHAAQHDRLALAARRYAKLRLKRKTLFPQDLFADPAWDILIDLFAAASEGKAVMVSSACVAADVPPTTALRWLTCLEREGLVERAPDALDKRRSLVRITAPAEQAMSAWFALALEQSR